MNAILEELPNLNSLEELTAAFDEELAFEIEGKMFCPNCRQLNRFHVETVHLSTHQQFAASVPRRKSYPGRVDGRWVSLSTKPELLLESQFRFRCVTCRVAAQVVVVKLVDAPNLMIIFPSGGSVATVHTPDAVKYYLEQAYQSYSARAYSATLAMYRTALDAILFNAGYEKGMVGAKIAAMEADIKEGRGPKWARDLAVPYIRVIKNLGNSSLHIANEDLSEERSIGDDLIQQIEITLHAILDDAYEKEAREKDRLVRLEAASKKRDSRSGK